MSEFRSFKLAVQKKFDELVASNTVLFLTDVEKDVIWETYLNSYPAGTNNIYKERGEHDCNTCKQFLRPFGNVVAIVNNKLVSIWDVAEQVPYPYNVVAQRLTNLVTLQPIKEVFITKFANCGTDHNHAEEKDGSITTWEHFHYKLPKQFVDTSADSVEAKQGTLRDSRNVFQRSLKEISIDAVKTALELIAQNSLYRGEESKGILETFSKYQQEYLKVPLNERDNYCWATFIKAGQAISKIRNSAIGTLLTDISEGRDLDYAVTAFEKIMAPANYKRPTAVLTKTIIEQAQKKIEELGLGNSLGRRFATVEDITVNNVIFADRDAKKKMNASVFDDLKEEVTVSPKTLNKVEEVTIEDFINNIVPKASSIKIIPENVHTSSLMSLIAPQDKEAPSMFKWANNFSWSYNGEVADSIKEAVKARGGNVTGVLRFSVMWGENQPSDNSDLDAHCTEPLGHHIYFGDMVHPTTTGHLDVDVRFPNNQGNKNVVENITWSNISKMQKGIYRFSVNNFALRGKQKGFIAEIEFNGQIFQFNYNKHVRNGESIDVASVEFDGKDFKIIKSLPSSAFTKEIWGVKTNNFQKVSMIMSSPNYWDQQQGIGNKHYFFILEGCKNPSTPRGFYNEFLKQDLMEQKRVFEALGDKMRVESSDNQLSGLGFSSTQRNSVIAKVEGSFARTIKINF